MGATFYAEPVLTFDLDIFVILPQTGPWVAHARTAIQGVASSRLHRGR